MRISRYRYIFFIIKRLQTHESNPSHITYFVYLCCDFVFDNFLLINGYFVFTVDALKEHKDYSLILPCYVIVIQYSYVIN